MRIDRVVFVLSSVLILLCIVLSYLFSSRWLIGATIVGINMVQAEFTGVCPVTMMLRKLGFKPQSGTP
jgi:hypothetical protein